MKIEGEKFTLNGEPFVIWSGAIHYFRTLPEYWEDRLAKLKAAGFNTVETYVCWNLHEPTQGKFDFSGGLDLERFLATADRLGLYAIVRPGPYICAEWDMGGLPSWLLKDKNMRLRCDYPPYIERVEIYLKELFGRLKNSLIGAGGNVIALQIENEYGSFGNDKNYLRKLKSIYEECGMDVLYFTSDGDTPWMLSGGTLDGVLAAVNLGSGAARKLKALDRFGVSPKMCAEFWCGWFDGWGKRGRKRSVKRVCAELKYFLDSGASFNFYMFHGGTNFGFNAGANNYFTYAPTTTSYDYDALLTECGGYTKKYFAVRKLLTEKQGAEPVPLPPPPRMQNIGTIKPDSWASLWDNLSALGTEYNVPVPESMEYFGQKSGLIYYRTVLKGDYGNGFLTLSDMHDRAYVYRDGKRIATFDNVRKKLIARLTGKDAAFLKNAADGTEIGVLAEAMGHVNYGDGIYERKGVSAVKFLGQSLMDFTVICLPLDEISGIAFHSLAGTPRFDGYPLFFKGGFAAESGADCFVRLKGFTKGAVYVNGFNLGRFWSIGPQKALYLPGSVLKKQNEIVVLELECAKNPLIEISADAP